jgi:hypothetical protein
VQVADGHGLMNSFRVVSDATSVGSRPYASSDGVPLSSKRVQLLVHRPDGRNVLVQQLKRRRSVGRVVVWMVARNIVGVVRRVVFIAERLDGGGTPSHKIGVQVGDACVQRLHLCTKLGCTHLGGQIRPNVGLGRREPCTFPVGQDFFAMDLVRFEAKGVR